MRGGRAALQPGRPGVAGRGRGAHGGSPVRRWALCRRTSWLRTISLGGDDHGSSKASPRARSGCGAGLSMAKSDALDLGFRRRLECWGLDVDAWYPGTPGYEVSCYVVADETARDGGGQSFHHPRLLRQRRHRRTLLWLRAGASAAGVEEPGGEVIFSRYPEQLSVRRPPPDGDRRRLRLPLLDELGDPGRTLVNGSIPANGCSSGEAGGWTSRVS